MSPQLRIPAPIWGLLGIDRHCGCSRSGHTRMHKSPSTNVRVVQLWLDRNELGAAHRGMMESYQAISACQRELTSSDQRYANIIAAGASDRSNSVQEEMKRVALQLADIAGKIEAAGGPDPAFTSCTDFKIKEVRDPFERWCADAGNPAPAAAATTTVEDKRGAETSPGVNVASTGGTDALIKAQEAARAAVAASLAGTSWSARELAGGLGCYLGMGFSI